MQIELKLNKDFERFLDELKIKYGEDFEYINGVHPSQLDNAEFRGNFKNKSTLADATIDPNANANHKDIRSYMTEKNKSTDKVQGLSDIFTEMKSKWGLRTAKQWFEQEFSKGFYLNDSTNVQIPYCWANSLSRLAKEGLFFLGNYHNEPPQHLSTFIDDVIEFVSFLSNRQSGAVGLPDIIIWSYYFWEKDCKTGHIIKDKDYYLRQEFQKFIFRVNQPFLRLDQCAFTNVSIFDRAYIEGLFGGVEYPDGEFVIDHIEDIIECQKVFMEVVSEIRKSQMFTFPVLTYSLLYRDNKFVDEDFARWCSKHNMEWNDSNFFMSDDVGVLSNCCFDGDQEFYYYDADGNKYLTTFKNYVENRLKKSYDGQQLINTVQNEFIEDHEGNKKEIKAVSKLPNKFRTLIKLELEDGRIFSVTPDQKFFDNNSKKLITAQEILKNPDIFDIGSKINDTSYVPSNNPVYDIEVSSEDHTFMIGNSRVENCRLLSSTTKLQAFQNSIGGTALSIGSCRVSTINLMRIAYETKFNKSKYLKLLRDRVELDCKALYSMRQIIKNNIRDGLLPNYVDGAVELEKQYCTIGILGLYEVMDSFGLINTDEFGYKSYTEEAIEFAKEIFAVLNDVKDNFECDFTFNIESIPAENCAGVICSADNLLFEQEKYFIYSNQWIPLMEKCTIQEKCRISSILDKECSGGAIAHINVENRFPNEESAWEMLNYIAQNKVIYFAFNSKINVCEDKHASIGTTVCPICGKPIVDQFSRVVGFYTPVSSYQKIRKKEFNKRQWYDVLEKDKMF